MYNVLRASRKFSFKTTKTIRCSSQMTMCVFISHLGKAAEAWNVLAELDYVDDRGCDHVSEEGTDGTNLGVDSRGVHIGLG